MRTTQECKQFLAEFFKATPTLIPPMYDGAEGVLAQGLSEDEKYLKITRKCKPRTENSYIHGDTTEVCERGKAYPRGVGYYKGVPFATANVAVERHFTLKEEVLGTGVIFIVIEALDGELYLGEHIGD